jgi:tetratricopeptide (TPR) repeat protein
VPIEISRCSMLTRLSCAALPVLVIILIPCAVPALCQDKEKTVTALEQFRVGGREEAAGDLKAAERHYLAALESCKRGTDYSLEVTILKSLGDLYSRERNAASAASAYNEELDLLLQHQRGIDLRVGTALFDLQSVFEATAQNESAESFFKRAVKFYSDCMKDARLALTCDRRLADAEGLRGASLFNQHRYTEAEPLLKNVIERTDDAVRPETLIATLMAYESILALRGDAIATQRCLDRLNSLKRRYPNALMK